MARKPLIAGNWKLNKNAKEAAEFAAALEKFIKEQKIPETKVEVAIIPTFTSLAAAKTQLSTVKLGAQDLSQYLSGAYTGEVSAEMLLEQGVDYVLVGHSERREIFKEDDAIINQKVLRALGAGLKVIFCCGESLSTREAGNTDAWVAKQTELGLAGVNKDNFATNIVVAYEPIWAIGTGKTCDSAEANRVIQVIRNQIRILFGADNADAVRILYGGSVKPSSIAEQMAQSDIDGALIGGASLVLEDLATIVATTAGATALSS
jgi:triosephosphate isomerase